MKQCIECGKKFIKRQGTTGKYCSSGCWIRSDEHTKVVRKALKDKPLSDAHRKKLSLAKLGKKQTKEFVKKRLYWLKGYRWRRETIQKRADSNRGQKRVGDAHKNIVDGIAKRHGYSSYEEMPHPSEYNPDYRGDDWDEKRKEARKRDNDTCQKCGRKDRLQVHHIVPWRISHDSNLSNLITLCIYCHQGLKSEELKNFKVIRKSRKKI